MSRISKDAFGRAAREDARHRALKALEAMSDDEDRAITEAAEADPDAQPVDELIRRKRGRPPLPETKEKVSLRLDRDVLERFRSRGAGWQTRINDTLREAIGMDGNPSKGGGLLRNGTDERFVESSKRGGSAKAPRTHSKKAG